MTVNKWDCLVIKLCLNICNLRDCSMLGLPVLHYLSEFAQIHEYSFTREGSGIPISSKIFQFVVIHTVKSFRVVNEAVDVFLELPCFLYDSMNVGNLVSASSALSKPSLYIWRFLVHVLLKPSLKDFEHYLAKMWNECNCGVVWTFFGTAFLWDWNEKTFSSPLATAEFSRFAGILSAALSQHHLLGFEIAQLEFHHFY